MRLAFHHSGHIAAVDTKLGRQGHTDGMGVRIAVSVHSTGIIAGSFLKLEVGELHRLGT